VTDIVERLRVHAWRSDGWTRQDAAEAADEIERLRAERDDLKADYMRLHIDVRKQVERICELEAERDVHRNKFGDQILRRQEAMLALGAVMIVMFLAVLIAHFLGFIGAPQETRP